MLLGDSRIWFFNYRDMPVGLPGPIDLGSGSGGWSKSIAQQFKKAFGSDRTSIAWYRNVALTVTAGLAIFYSVSFGWGADSVRSPFDLKVATVCFAVAGVCVLLAADKVLVLSGAMMVPAVLATSHIAFIRDRKHLTFYFASLAFGFLVLVLGGFIRSIWQARLSRPGR